MATDELLRRQRLIMAVGVGISLVLPVVAWAMVPVGGVDLEEGRRVLFEHVRTHGLDVVSVDTAPHRSLPVWVEWHPVRLLEGEPGGLSADTSAWHYRFRTAEAVEFDCELHTRDGEVLWIRLDGTEEAAGAITPLRTDLRRALPWLPVSSPWK